MGHQLECDEWRNLKSKIWRQLKAFEVLSGLNSSLSSSILVNNLRSLVQTNIEECRVEVHPEVKIEVKSDVEEEDDANGNLEQDYNNEEELNANDYLEVEVGNQLMLENNVDQNLFEEGQHLYTTNNNTSVDQNFQKSPGDQQKQQPSSPQTQTPHRSQLTMEASENVQIDEPVQLQICQVEEEDEEASPPFSPIVSPVLQPMDKNRHESSQGSSSQLPPPLEKLPPTPPPPIFSAIKEKIKRRGRPMKIFPMKDAEEGGHVSTNTVNLGSPFGSYTGKKRGPKVGWGGGTICSFKDKSRVRRVKLNLKIGSNLEESLRLQKKPCRTKKMMANTEKDKLGSPISKDQRKHLVMKNQSRLYICQVCSKSLRNGAILFQHMFIHKQEFRVSCTQCDRKFLQRTHLNQHMRGAHTGERPYQCRQCPSAFFQQGHLNQHMRIHNTFKKHRRTLPKMN